MELHKTLSCNINVLNSLQKIRGLFFIYKSKNVTWSVCKKPILDWKIICLYSQNLILSSCHLQRLKKGVSIYVKSSLDSNTDPKCQWICAKTQWNQKITLVIDKYVPNNTIKRENSFSITLLLYSRNMTIKRLFFLEVSMLFVTLNSTEKELLGYFPLGTTNQHFLWHYSNVWTEGHLEILKP